ncbi:tRNA pseudouridine(13) synthase TruD [Glaciecola sp. SC05]|uniref:tRNA pseudouridine(13) synthase TruD n=1 Tax=Glaciecola sp. SC05 TaxID=1987355 RepID=UPI003526C53E
MNNSEVSEASTSHWHRLHGSPLSTGDIKTYADDFVVEEQLGFELTGEGEHHLLWIEKTNTNTAFVAEQLAKFSGISLRDISYAGRKDKFARTRQYFSVYQGKHSCPNWQDFESPDISILNATRHNKKLRTGALQGNKFSLIVRNVATLDPQLWQQRMLQIQNFGVPNYYGQQRFGEMHTAKGIVLNGNLSLGMRMAQGEKIKNRNKRSMAISALRSYLFNEVLSQRVSTGLHTQIMMGDALQLAGSNSYFVVSASDNIDALYKRLAEQDVQITAPLLGSGKSAVQADTEAFESGLLAQHPAIIKTLTDVGLKQERRPILLYPKDIQWSLEDNNLHLSFSLPSGCFATAVLREIIASEGSSTTPTESP